jgi:uncharacterized metal-binding protein YceD (DUF177 family)
VKVSLDELRSLPQQRLDIDFKESLQGTQAVKPAVGDLSVTARSTGMLLTGRIQTLLKLNCDRCLRPYFQSIAVDIDERFVIESYTDIDLTSNTKERELKTSSDFYDTLPADNVLDITDVVYQAVTLATPNSCSCGTECPGPPTSTQSGKKGNLKQNNDVRKGEKQIDPRWKNLKSLLPNEDRETKS